MIRPLSGPASGRDVPSRRLLLSTQLVFNVGFYAIVPFLALHMSRNLALAGWMVGLVLGVRTFSQQGMFFIGGSLAERYGCRTLILCGCVVRIAGYLCFAVADSAAAMLLGACLTGVGGALFSPCLEALAARIDAQSPADDRRRSIFAQFAVYGEVGAVAGPLLGSLLFDIGFAWMALASAGVFLLALLVLWRRLPPLKPAARVPGGWGWSELFANRPFLLFMLFYSSYLLSYNQMYLGLPVELERSHGGARDMAWLFALASVLVVACQMPLAALCKRWPPRLPLVAGFALLAAAFVNLALWTAVAPLPGAWRLLPAVLTVVLLTAGQMCAVPVAMALVPAYARQRLLPVHYGALASAGGLMVLLGNMLLGRLFAAIPAEPEAGVLAWSVAAVFPALSALYFAFARQGMPRAA
ncbi:MFS transporter [Thauera linaloolentis]|uniref:Major facilitator superfamily protein n=1 Tax=Thauera linaloolentis (strain DSM 12138 / JCM 21573 / CCUG 41526 / CIP 105981 / IAM 15112 / NBRC 102519 / 47Lol) TaxID=1123367 RepID=N6YR56_THAL4|nr:MFS transporter [Thauera linaloolentis]ENO84718.1 major facilitator superfamily protein [Thauera linaloolentis 47Lol = DSM 12138]MCM8567423.1 MFS transporter [Thauera linaloolentis]